MKSTAVVTALACIGLIIFATNEASAKIIEKEVTYSSDGTNFKGYVAYDNAQTSPRPGVIVVHEWWGHNEYARKRARMLAGLGYTAMAIDMYGDGKTADNPGDASKLAGQTMSNLDTARARFTAALEYLRRSDKTNPGKIAAIGYCFGGGVVLQMARMGVDLQGVVSFHGSLGTQVPAAPGTVKAAMLVCNGGADSFVSEEQVDAFKKEMAEANVHLKFVSYPGAKHSFTNPESTSIGKKFGLDIAYNKTADTKSWSDMKDFLRGIFSDKK